ncbi:MAG: 4Fe-4S binding protein [Deltaproteobacteria bacterium]|jgi:dissimilatory sulfite reductase (desulfoviridin) alpha/beta subunit|nr:4Fe-4S binding protein [Deltaproteobacteria bacterium]
MAVDYQALKNGGFMRQRQKDHFSLRLKVVGGNLTTERLRVISQAADKFGVGRVHLTSRQGVEIPFVKLADVGEIKSFLAQGGVETGVCGARARTVTACQGSEVCPSGCVDTLALAQEFSQRYFGRELPHKFKLGVTGCQNNCLKAEENDLGVKGGYLVAWRVDDCSLCGVCAKACRRGAIKVTEETVHFAAGQCNHCGRCVKSCPTGAWSGRSGYLVSFGGTFGNNIAPGQVLTPLLTELAAVLAAADAALDFFATHGQPKERFRGTIERVGWETLSRLVGERLGSSH